MLFQNIFLTISILGVMQGILLALLIFLYSKMPKADRRLLALIFLSWSVAMLLITLVNSGLVIKNHIFEIIEYLLGFLVGPLFYIYLSMRNRSETQFSPGMLWHFLPAGLFMSYAIYYMIGNGNWSFNVIFLMFHLQFYFLLSTYYYFRIKKTGIVPKGDWSRLLLMLLGLVGASQWLRFYLSGNETFDLVIPSVASLSFYCITLVGFRRSDFLKKSHQNRSQELIDPRKIDELNQLMKEEAIFQKQDLTLSQVAILLEIHPNQLSSMINQHFRQSFRDYINSFRVEKAKQLLLKDENALWTIEAIAQEAGFNSRSTFYQAFKNLEGITPTQFKKNNLS